MTEEIEKENFEDYYRLQSILDVIDGFIQSHQKISYIDFDYYIVRDLTLFSIEPEFDFDKLEQIINEVNSVMPAVKKIFAKPIIHLKDSDDVLPVESVHIINQNTIQNAASHSENISNITEEGLKPLKLLTRVYEDNYGIYENIVFCNYIDEVMHFVRKNILSLNNLLYASEIMEFNLLERINHLNYFLALGKLHTGYIRDFDRYYNLSKKLVNALIKISETIQPRLKRPIYQHNKIRNKHLPIKKTNIFSMQKDYHQIYKSYRYLLGNDYIKDYVDMQINIKHIESNYFEYLQLLTIFSIGHFNFFTDEKKEFDLKKLKINFGYKKWNLELVNYKKKGLLLTFHKDITYKILLYPCLDFKEPKVPAGEFDDDLFDEIIICSPFEYDYIDSKTVFISMENIDSFRRIQQIIFKGMIYADVNHDICPFCGDSLTYDEIGKQYICESCRTIIKEEICPSSGLKYYTTSIAHLEDSKLRETLEKKVLFYSNFDRVELGMAFRNITKINLEAKPVCPYCNVVHHKTEYDYFDPEENNAQK